MHLADGLTFYTIADRRFFVGAVALLNSLRLSGNEEPLVLLDAGLTAHQRLSLEPHARVVDLPRGASRAPYLSKPFPQLFDPEGLVAIIDSDIIVTARLAPAVACGSGAVRAYADHPLARGRWFGEWSATLGLRAPLRRQTYVNSGFVLVDVRRQPDFLARWWELCSRVPGRDFLRDHRNPFDAADQDALNALLMSELPEDELEVLPETEFVLWDALRDVEVLDERTLACRRGAFEPLMLHYSFSPKPWERRAWLRAQRNAFMALLPRLLFAADVPIRLDARHLPVWVRPSRAGGATLAVLDVAHRAASATLAALPPRAREVVLRWLQR